MGVQLFLHVSIVQRSGVRRARIFLVAPFNLPSTRFIISTVLLILFVEVFVVLFFLYVIVCVTFDGQGRSDDFMSAR